MRSYANTVITAIAADLVAWLRRLPLTPDLATCEPKALRYRLLHVPARLTRGARRVNLRCWRQTYGGLMSDAVLDDSGFLAARERLWTATR